MDDQLHHLLSKLIEKNTIKINKAELKLQILSHPSYPSLHAITGVLDHFKIDNIAIEVPTNLETLKQLPTAFMTLLKKEHEEEFVIITQKKKTIQIEFNTGAKQTASLNEFLEQWVGLVIAIEKNTDTEHDESVGSKKIVYLLGAILSLSMVGHFIYLEPTYYQLFYFFLCLTGFVFSYLIVQHELGFQSKAVNQLCSAKESTSCEEVLNSKGATIFKHLKLSDLSLIFFNSLILSSYLLVKEGANFSLLMYLSVAALPITAYSIHYQYSVVKKWCPLCLGIVAVLWLQAGGLLFSGFQWQTAVDFQSIFILGICLTLITFLWLLIRPLLTDQKKLEEVSLQHNVFKRNFDLFYAIFNQGPPANLLVENEIKLGIKAAPLELILVTNPTCFYCKEAHQNLEYILDKYAGEVKATIRFNIKPKDKEKPGYNIALRLLEMYNTLTTMNFEVALSEVYQNDADPEKWLAKWGEALMPATFEAVLSREHEWCKENDTNFTPAIFIDGKPFPKEYDRNELIYFIDELIEQTIDETTVNQVALSH